MENGDRMGDGLFSPYFPHVEGKTPSTDKVLGLMFGRCTFTSWKDGLFLGREAPDGPVKCVVKFPEPREDRPGEPTQGTESRPSLLI